MTPISIGVAIICAAWAIYATQHRGQAELGCAPGWRPRSNAPAFVTLAPVRAERFSQKLEALGNARANESVDVSSKTSNIVTAMRFRDGERVQRGQVLVQLDDAQVRADVAAAEAALTESESQYNRSRELLSTQVLSKSSFEQLEATLKANRARVASASARLEDTVIRAPFSGRVGLRRVSVGTLISPGTVITTLDDTSVIKLDFSVPENFLASLREGLSVRASAPAFPGRTFAGKVASIDSRVDMDTRSVTVRALLANEDGALRPGMFLNVALANDEREALMIPEEALTPEAERQFVFVVADGKAAAARSTHRRPPSGQPSKSSPGSMRASRWSSKVHRRCATAARCASRRRPRTTDRMRSKRRRTRRAPTRRRACASEPREAAPMMISDLSVRRPVFATVMSLLLFILGVGAVTRLSLREFPDVERPVVNIETRYRGASSDVVESRITQIIENEISGIEGVERLNSSSRDERSQINVEFSLERDLDSAANDVRERLSRVAARLPLESDPPQITKVDSGTDPIVWINVTSTQRSILELTDYMQRYLVDQFATLDGVANVRVNGGRRYAMRLWLSRENLAARQLTVADVENALLRENVELPAGRLESTQREFTLRTDTNLRTERGVPQSRGWPRSRRLPGAPRRSRGRAVSRPTTTAASRAPTASSACRWPSSRRRRRTCSRRRSW